MKLSRLVYFLHGQSIAFLVLSGFFLTVISTLSFANPLEIKPGDAYIEIANDEKGFDIYIRAVPNLGSVLITESSADPLKKSDTFTLRSWDYNPVNGDEKRILNGKFLESDSPLYFLLDSSPEPNKIFGSAYRIYVPFQLTYGYPWSREGQLEVHQGTWLNIRTFEKPYADYSGPWRDNPFVLSMKSLPPAPEPEILEVEDGPVNNVEEAVDKISQIISISGDSIDLVLVLDTTVSMKDDIDFIRESLVPLVRKQVEDFSHFRVGLVLYRDYKEAYLTRSKPFTEDLETLQKQLDKVTVSGGRDLPEAVNEGIFAALSEFDWEASKRMIIQVGDAPAHDKPRGAITPEMVEEQALKLNVFIHNIRLPDKKRR